MAWIYNKQTKVLTECHNKDVIKICEKDIKGYFVSESKTEALKVSEETQNLSNQDEVKGLSKLSVEELKALAEGKGIEGFASLTKPELLKVLKEA